MSILVRGWKWLTYRAPDTPENRNFANQVIRGIVIGIGASIFGMNLRQFIGICVILLAVEIGREK